MAFDPMSFDPMSFDPMSVNLTEGSLEILLTVPVRKFTNIYIHGSKEPGITG